MKKKIDQKLLPLALLVAVLAMPVQTMAASATNQPASATATTQATSTSANGRVLAYQDKTYTPEEIFSNYLPLGEGVTLKSPYSKEDGLLLAYNSIANRYGFLNFTGEVAIPFQFYNASEFSDGMAMVYYGEYISLPQYPGARVYVDPAGYINTKGEQVIGYDYRLWQESGGYNFSEGLGALMVDEDKDAYVDYVSFFDKTGKQVIVGDSVLSSTVVRNATPFRDGYSVINYDTLIDKTGKVILRVETGTIKAMWEGKMSYYDNTLQKHGYMDVNGKVVIPCKYDYAYNFVNGLAKVRTKTADGKYFYGFVDHAGKEVIPPIYTDGKTFSEGLVAVSKDTPNGKRYGYVDGQNNVVIDFQYENAGSFQNGLAAVKKDGKYGYINPLGQVVVPFVYDEIYENKDYKEVYTIVEKGTFTNGKALARIGTDYLVLNQPKLP